MSNSYRPMMEFTNEPPAGNALRFATYDEAYENAKALMYRWFVPCGFHVDESDDMPTHRWIDGRLESL